MDVYLVDGTYELFRHYYAVPSHVNAGGREVGATRGVVASIVGMLEAGNRHLGVATDHVIESFRNELWPGYKTSAGVDPLLLQQFPLLEDALRALGVLVWPMVELEADDALGAAALAAGSDASVERVYICTPDKDLAQCVRDGRVVQFDRRKRLVIDEAGVIAKFGVAPESIPDYLALVGDSADGFPGLPGWGARSAATVLARWRHIDEIPADPMQWDVGLRGAARLAVSLQEGRDLAYLFRDLATLRTEAPMFSSVEELRWRGSSEDWGRVVDVLEAPDLANRVQRLAEKN